MKPSDQISATLHRSVEDRGIGVIAYLTAGYPATSEFEEAAASVSKACDVLEIGIPFSDPLADGPTIQMSSSRALANGTTPSSAIESVGRLGLPVPVVAMTYLNPLLSLGIEPFSELLRDNGFSGVVVPDLPLEAAGGLMKSLENKGLAYCGLVTPFTSVDRVKQIARESTGFVYAVTSAGTTGQDLAIDADVRSYLGRVREAATPTPTAAGFGIRHAHQVLKLVGAADAVIIGSALVDQLTKGEDPGVFLKDIQKSLMKEAVR